MLFFSFFKTLVNHEVTVELKNDISIRGTLKSVDQYLNIKLDDISVLEELKYPHLVRAIPTLRTEGIGKRIGSHGNLEEMIERVLTILCCDRAPSRMSLLEAVLCDMCICLLRRWIRLCWRMLRGEVSLIDLERLGTSD